jgi:hypothetical protein
MLVLLPIDLDAPFSFGRQGEQVGAIAAMNRDASPLRDVADHGVAGHRLAALGVADHQPVHALNADAPPEP